MWLTRLALRNPVLILMMSLMTLALGFVSVRHLSVDLFPDITVPLIRVAIFYTGAGPTDIEKSITMPVERAVSASPGVDRVESVSKQGVSLVSVWFQYGTNLDNAQFDVSQRIAQIMNNLPPGIQQPFNIKFDITNIPVVQVAVGSEELDEKQLYDLALNVIEPQLERIKGVASATPGGGKVREIEVELQREALRARGLAPLDVVQAVRASNLLMPSGNIRVGDRDYNVFANTQFQQAKPLGDVVVRPPTQVGNRLTGPVRVGDVAKVFDSTADQNEIVRINGQRGVYLRVLKQPGANSIQVVDAVRAALPNLRGIPPTVKLAISFDQSSYIRAAVKALEHEAVQGGILAILVILIFLVSLRATGIVAVAIPLSIVATFVLLFFSGQTLNVFTLGGLALGVGRLVDDSIVELENIHRHLALGQNRRQAVLSAAQEVAMPILVSTITTIVVFFPVLFLFGIARNLFLPLALTISFALIMSFFVSRTVTPLLCMMWLPGGHGAQPSRGFAGWVTRKLETLDDAYAVALAAVLRHRFLTIAIILAFFAGSLLLAKRIGTEFFPDSDESQFSLVYKAPIGTRVEKTEQIAQRLEEAVNKTLGKDGFYTTMITDSGLPAGRTAIFSANTGPHAGTLQVNLVPRVKRPISDVVASERLRSEIQGALPGTQLYFFVGGIVKRVLNFGSAAPIDVEILGYDLEQGAQYARAVHAAMRNLSDKEGRPLLTDVQISREENYPQLDVHVDREKAGRLGLTESHVAETVLTSLTGSSQIQPTQFTDPVSGNEYFINVRMEDRYRSHIDDVNDIALRSPSGALVPLASIAKVTRSSGPVLINRKYLQRIVDVTANVAPGKDLGTASAAVERVLRDVRAPEGFTATLSGQAQAQKDAFSGLSLAALMAIALVYMVLASQFRSLLDPLVIMFSVPLGVSGVFLMLWITGTTLSVNSFMGIIMMVGIVVSNGVLLVDFANVLRERDGLDIVSAVVRAGRTRLRPILMTTIATIVGLIPMALGIGEGSETNLPLARAVIGGLTGSTFFTLFLVPALYSIADRWRRPQPKEEEQPGVAHAPA
ncbi:MAG TPA: efflux RND transporter permease subunit [Myxococcales bacterium]|nr:efflux RND transporter permease subunit [Myxococcales bacterium]